METIACVVEDKDSWWQPAHADESEIVELLNSKGIQFLGWPEWLKIDATEKALGASQDRERIKLVDRGDFLDAAFKNYQA
jgi:ferredoxin--NADP+ reductase